nr:hypothetical protein [Tanacetum cinerariifolium]
LYVEVALQAPPSPDYIPGPEEPEQAPPPPDYPPEYVPESDLEAHPEDDDDEDPEEDPVDYPTDGGDDGDDEEGSSEDDEDDDMDIEADEEEEHPAPADFVVVASTAADQAPSVEETEPFETDELLAMSSPPASPLSPWSSPPPQIPFPPLPPILSPPSPMLSPALPPSPIRSLGYRAAMIRLLAEGLRVDYGFVATMDREIMRDPEREAGRLNMLFRDRRAHVYTRHLMETEARMSREAWVRSTDASDLVRGEGLAGGPTQPELPEEAGSGS